MARRRRSRKINGSSEPWTAAEELRLRELAGKVQRDEVARILTREFGVPRTVAAVCVRAKKLDLSLWWRGYGQAQIAKIFGVTASTVSRWGKDGLLKYRLWEGGGRGRFAEWHIEERDLLDFIDRCTWAYDLDRMQPGPLKMRAEVAHRADPWLTATEAAGAMGISRELVGYYARAGLIPHQRRVAGVGMPKIMVRAIDLPGLRQTLRERALSNIRAAIQRRDRTNDQRIEAATPAFRFEWRDGHHVPIRTNGAAA